MKSKEEAITKRKYARYTKEETDIIIGQVQLYPENKQYAFHQASVILKNRTSLMVHNYYYKVLTNNKTITTTGSAIGFTSNTKNVKRNADGSFERREPLKPMFVILRQLLTLEPKELLKVKLILEEVC